MIPGIKCKTITKDIRFLPKTELCAGRKYIQRIDAYTYKRQGTLQNPMINQVQHQNQVNDTKIKYGKIESCVGDSGGPLWKWMGESKPKATVPHLHFFKFKQFNFANRWINRRRQFHVTT